MAGRIVAGVVALCLVSSSSSSTAAPAFLPAFIPSAWLALHGRTVNAGLCLSSPPLATPQPPSPGSLRASPLFPGSTRPGALSRSAERTSGANQAGEDGEAAAAVAQGDPPDWRSQNPGYQVLGSRGAEAAAGAKAAPAPKVLGKKKRKKGQPYFDPLTPPPGPEEFPAYEPTDFFRFELVHQSTKSRARVGRIHTPHGIIDTPGFVPVATVAAQKAVDHNVLDPMADQQLMFCNTYHLLLQPGTEIIEKAGGLHKFMGRDPTRPLITDSGGFQVFSLAYGSVGQDINEGNIKGTGAANRRGNVPSVLKTSEEGVTFRSYRDGRSILLTPETTVQAQKAIGADIIIPLDELPPLRVTQERLRESVLMSHRWEARSLKEHLKDRKQQAMYAVVHGGTDKELRAESAAYLSSLPFDGFAMGGSFGKLGDDLVDLIAYLTPLLPADRPNHLLGIADIGSIDKCVPHGVDTFDSAFPSRNGRHGSLLTHEGTVKIGNAKYANMHEPISAYFPHYTAAYLHHLHKAKEPLSGVIFTMHNLCFMQDHMREVRRKIMNNEI